MRAPTAHADLFGQRASTCGYLRKHVPRPWLQFTYEDLVEPQLRNRTVASVYAALGVDDKWSAWRDGQHRQSRIGQTVRWFTPSVCAVVIPPLLSTASRASARR